MIPGDVLPVPALVVGLVLAAVAIGIRVVALRRSRRDRRRLLDRSLYERLVAPPPRIQGPLRIGLFALGVGLGGAVLGGAGWSEADSGETPSHGALEAVLVLDASNSMLARDTPPSRLERQRSLAGTLAQRLDGSIGVVYFAGSGYVLAPLTPDRGSVAMQVAAVRPAHVGRGGSALAEGVGQALDLLAGGEEGAVRSVILFSDGEETRDQPLDDALERARETGVAVHTVGIGTEEGGRIPVGGGDALLPPEPDLVSGEEGEGPFLRGPGGEVVTTRLDEAGLRRIAEATGGLYVPGTPEGVERIVETLGQDGAPGERRPGRASLLLLLAFGLLWVEGFLFRSG